MAMIDHPDSPTEPTHAPGPPAAPEGAGAHVHGEEQPGYAPPEPTRAGYITLAGRPNAGKSTLLNALVGTRLSIVTPQAQTTWQRVTGIHSEDGVQMIFLDTPGLLDVRDLLQRSMLSEALTAVSEADVLLLVVDASREMDQRTEDALKGALEGSRAPRVVALNKVDLATSESLDRLRRWASEELGGTAHEISALTGEGVEELASTLRSALPESPFLFPEEDIASQPVRFFVGEMVRETIFELYRQEIPYSTFCVVEEFRENQEPIYIGATLYVERESQKGIVVGKGGTAIRELGKLSRGKIEHFLGRPVYLDLWVKALAGWRRKRAHLSRLGFHLPEDDHDESR